MKKKKDIDSILDSLERRFSRKIDQLDSDRLFDEILAQKNEQINELKTLPENAEILKKLRELERIKASYSYRFIERARVLLLAMAPIRWVLYLLRKAF